MLTKGRHSYIGSYEEIQFPNVKIGSFCSLANNIIFHGASNHKLDTISSFPFLERLGWEGFKPNAFSKGDILIGNDVWIGDNVTFLSGVTIGDGVAIGAKSVVATTCEPYGVYAGNPAKLTRYRFPSNIILALLKIEWWNWDDNLIRQKLGMNIIDFVKENYHG